MADAASSTIGDALARLNRMSLTRTFTPQTDLDWSAVTTDGEFEALYPTLSLLFGTGADGALDASGRANYVKYQQMNLMAFTGLLERHGIRVLALMYDLDDSQPFTEYLGNFLKEEVYHYTMFDRAVRTIHASMTGYPPLPTRGLERTLSFLFCLIGCVPARNLRANLAFTFFRFAEQVTIVLHQMVQSTIRRPESLINQIWAFHALDEARHLAFDDMVLGGDSGSGGCSIGSPGLGPRIVLVAGVPHQRQRDLGGAPARPPPALVALAAPGEANPGAV